MLTISVRDNECSYLGFGSFYHFRLKLVARLATMCAHIFCARTIASVSLPCGWSSLSGADSLRILIRNVLSESASEGVKRKSVSV
jgi:hypothetical protein